MHQVQEQVLPNNQALENYTLTSATVICYRMRFHSTTDFCFAPFPSIMVINLLIIICAIAPVSKYFTVPLLLHMTIIHSDFEIQLF